MTAYHLAPSARDARLADALCHGGVEPWELVDPVRARDVLGARVWLIKELRLWADAAGSTRRYLDAPPELLGYKAACSIIAQPVAYAYGAVS